MARGDSVVIPETRALSADQVRLVLEVTRRLNLTDDLDVLLNRIAEAATKLLDCERASIFLHDAEHDQLWTKVALHSNEIRVPATAGIVGCSFTLNQILLVDDPYSDPRFNPGPDRKSGFVTRNILSAPMVGADRKPIGVIQVINKRNGCFEPTEVALIQLLADQAGVALQRYRLQQAAMEAAELRREVDLARRNSAASIAACWRFPASTSWAGRAPRRSPAATATTSGRWVTGDWESSSPTPRDMAWARPLSSRRCAH